MNSVLDRLIDDVELVIAAGDEDDQEEMLDKVRGQLWRMAYRGTYIPGARSNPLATLIALEKKLNSVLIKK
jgi:hypothetical protein